MSTSALNVKSHNCCWLRTFIIVIAIVAALTVILVVSHLILSYRITGAIQRGDVKAVWLMTTIDPLLVNATESDDIDMFYHPILTSAIKRKHTDIVLLLIKKGADVNAQDSVEQTPLHHAIKLGLADIAQLLLDHGANPNAADFMRTTPLLLAAESGQKDIARILLKHGADPNATDEHGEGSILYAAASGNVEMIRLLQSAGARSNSRVFEAASIGDLTILQEELKKDERLVARESSRGWLPLIYAVKNGQNEAVRLLISYGSPIDPLAVEYAARSDNLAVMKLLVSHGANVNAKAKGSDHLSLHIAAAHGDKDMVMFLLNNGADVNAISQGYTAEEMATKYKHSEIADIIRKHR